MPAWHSLALKLRKTRFRLLIVKPSLPGSLPSPQSKNQIGTRPIKFLVRAKGIEPSSSAWEADVLPLYHARNCEVILYYTVLIVQNNLLFYLTLRIFRVIIALQIPKIAITNYPDAVCIGTSSGEFSLLTVVFFVGKSHKKQKG